MNPSRLFILRPVATSLLMAAIVLAGAVAYRQLPVSALPEVDYPTIQIMTFYPGASPDVVASAITAPLERQFGQLPGLNQMTSTSSGGASVITLQFDLNLNIDVAEQEVQASINASGTFLPTDLPNPPIYSKTNPADAPILTLALASTTLPLSKVEDLADTQLAPKISQLSGVGLVSISGGQKPAVRIQANPASLSTDGLTLEDVRTAVAASNVNAAKGSFDGREQAFTIGADDRLSVERSVPPVDSRLPQRRADPAVGRGHRRRRRREREAGRLDEHAACRDRQRPASARRERHRRRRPRQGAPAAASKPAASGRAGVDPHRSHQHHPCIRPGRPVRADADDCSRRVGDLSLPSHAVSHRHPQRRGAAVARRHVRRHVPPRLQPQQPHADGADHLDRLRRRRCDRDDREHHALHRGRSAAARGGAQGIRADWIHDHLPHGVPHRCADSSALHGRHRRPAVPRIRGDARRHDSRVSGRFADAHADDVRKAPSSSDQP